MHSAASRSVDEYIEALPEPQRIVASRLRELLFENVPNIEERFSFKLPFYHYHGMFCYLRAADSGVYLCFCRGKDLTDAFPQLEQRERAAICCVKADALKDIQRLEVVQLITVAAEWNSEARLQKIPMVQMKNSKDKKQKAKARSSK